MSTGLRGILLASAVFSGACKDILVGGHHFVPADGAGGSGGSDGGGSGGAEPQACRNGLTACGEDCVALDSDSAHCGSCDHDCLGAACESGFCVPEVIASDVADPRGIAADEEHVYWTTAAGAVQRAPKSGGPIQTLVEDQESPGAIAVDQEFAYWINEETGRLVRMSKEGNGKPKTLATSPGLLSLAIDADSLYLSRKLKKGDIERIGKDGSGHTVLATDQPQPTHIVVGGDRILWTGTVESDDDGEDMPGGYVRSASFDGQEVETVAEGEGTILDLAIGGETPLWANGTLRQIRSRPEGSSEPIALVEDQDVTGLTADSQFVFWTTAGGTVRRVSFGGGAPRAIAIDVPGAAALVTSGPHVYFTRSGASGSILRVAK